MTTAITTTITATITRAGTTNYHLGQPLPGGEGGDGSDDDHGGRVQLGRWA